MLRHQFLLCVFVDVGAKDNIADKIKSERESVDDDDESSEDEEGGFLGAIFDDDE